MIDNKGFLEALFAEDAPYAHITDFSYDPGDIPADKGLIAWKGNYACRYGLRDGTNQYYTISVFSPDAEGIARRQKALFLRTRVIVLDDVREKLSITEAQKLPEPAYILETSAGSEQWGYILDSPCTDRGKVENLLDGLVSNGLAPDGKDPGMKGVTRYVRLPGGVNTKASKQVDGRPFNCRLLEWKPDRRVSIEELATPFNVDLGANRREARAAGAADLPDHPLLPLVKIKTVLGPGRFDITCPWVDEHTKAADNGSAVWTNKDGSIGFKCHHGSCEGRSARDLTAYLDTTTTAFSSTMTAFRIRRGFADMLSIPSTTPPPDFTTPTTELPPPVVDARSIMDDLRRISTKLPEAKQKAVVLMKAVDGLPTIDKLSWHEELCGVMGWSKTVFNELIKSLRSEWYVNDVKNHEIYKTIMYVKELDRLFDLRTGLFYTPMSFQNSYAHDDAEAKKTALEKGMARKVDKLNFAPGEGDIYVKDGLIYGNTWSSKKLKTGSPGGCTDWLEHWDKMGWGMHRDHMLKWMAYTLLHPENKINHMLLLGGQEGTGKDFLLYPLLKALGEYSRPIIGHKLLDDFNEYLLSCKYLNINETEMGEHKMAQMVSNILKPLTAAPPDTLTVNRKGMNHIEVNNIVNVAMTTNSSVPLRLGELSRRIYAMWTQLVVRDAEGEMTRAWQDYWETKWAWMSSNGGVEHCIWYLRNCVDISGFKPGAAPPMTDFLRDIAESSKSGPRQTIEAFIQARVGAFASDMMTASDAVATIKAASLSETTSDLVMHQEDWFTPTKLGRVLRDIPGMINKRAAKGHDVARLWIIRNHDKYTKITSGELYEEYYNQARMKRKH